MYDDGNATIQRLRLAPGECLIVKCHFPLTSGLADRVKEHVEKTLGNVPVLVIGEDIDLAVVVAEQTRPHRPIERIIELPPE